jgi:hypothetical protein
VLNLGIELLVVHIADFAYDVKTTEDGSYLIVGSSLSMPDANKTSPNYGGL